MSYPIRRELDGDAERMPRLIHRVFGTVETAESIRWELANQDPKCKREAFLVEESGELIGFGQYNQNAFAYHPQKFEISLFVDPDWRNRGIGGALYDRVMAEVAQHQSIAFHTGTREDYTSGIRFAEKQGYVQTMRTYESHLDLTVPEPAQYPAILARVEEQGYRLISLVDLAGDPERDRKLYQLWLKLRQDIPSPEPMTHVAFEQYQKGLYRPHAYLEAFHVAVKGEEWVALSSIWKTDEEGLLNTGITAVQRDHRGTGLAQAMKLKSIRRARQDGYKKIKTYNEQNNQRMLAINEQMGFERKPAWISYRLTL